MRRVTAVAAAVAVPAAMVLGAAGPAGACGGLVGENGTIELTRTTTLAAYSDGVERYVTAFEFTGEGQEVGSIVPLPDVPTEVTRAGDWTLQRLAQEVAPPAPSGRDADLSVAEDAAGVDVILETEVDALDITVISGGGDAVGQWAIDNGFLLTPDAPEVLDYYAERSPVFMAAKFDASRAADLGQGAGDSTPIMATIPTDDPVGAGAHPQPRPRRGPCGRGRRVPAHRRAAVADGRRARASRSQRSEQADGLLLDDLRSDVNMEWVPDRMWLSYMTLEAPADELDYDLAVATRAGRHAVARRRRCARSGRDPGAAAGEGAAGVAVRGGRGGRGRGAGRGLVPAERGRGRCLRRDGPRPGGWRPAADVTAVEDARSAPLAEPAGDRDRAAPAPAVPAAGGGLWRPRRGPGGGGGRARGLPGRRRSPAAGDGPRRGDGRGRHRAQPVQRRPSCGSSRARGSASWWSTATRSPTS